MYRTVHNYYLCSNLKSIFMKLTGKIAVVTGGSRGIGAAIVRELASQGASIVFSYNNSETQANDLVDEIARNGGQALAVKSNLVQDGSSTLINEAVQRFGGIDILVNNAGVFVAGPLAESDISVFDDNFNTNVKAVYETTQVASRFLREDGRIINIGSSVARHAFVGASAYGGTKAALVGITRSWAKEFAPKRITVNVVHPGSINTDMNPDVPENDFAAYQKSLNPLGRFGKPEEIAAAVAFLASPDAAFITGSELTVDGGLTA